MRYAIIGIVMGLGIWWNVNYITNTIEEECSLLKIELDDIKNTIESLSEIKDQLDDIDHRLYKIEHDNYLKD